MFLVILCYPDADRLVTYVIVYLLREAINKKRVLYKDIGFICFDPLPPPLNKDIENKDILLIYLTPSLLPKIRTYEPFVFGFKKPDFAFLSHNFYGVGKFKNKLVKCSQET